jgi:hypothetical protein
MDQANEVITIDEFYPDHHCTVQRGEIRATPTLPHLVTECWLSHCSDYRYAVWYMADPEEAPPLLAVMLNPSTATHEIVDRTVHTMLKRMVRFGYGSLCIVNLFAYRSKDPRDLLNATDPVGPLNDIILELVLGGIAYEHGSAMAGWGQHGGLMGRDAVVLDIAKKERLDLFCLKTTKDGHPGHPLYIPDDQPFLEFRDWGKLLYSPPPRRK